jgi:hypothetical protein
MYDEHGNPLQRCTYCTNTTTVKPLLTGFSYTCGECHHETKDMADKDRWEWENKAKKDPIRRGNNGA